MKPRYLIAAICFILCALILPRSTQAAPPMQDQPIDALVITGTPLSIYVGSNGSVQVYHQNYTHGATFGSGDSGFFLALGASVYGPNLPATNPSSAAYSSLQMTPVSHSGPSGSGTSSDPYRIITVHRLNEAGANLLVTQTVSYINGDSYFQLDWRIANEGSGETCFKAYHGADIYFADSDYGYGYYNQASGAVGGYNEARDWFMVFVPLTPATRYQEAGYSTLWSLITSATDLNNTVDTTNIDNGIALQWDSCVAGGGSTTISDLWSFGESEASVIPTFVAGGGGTGGGETATISVDVWAKDSPEDDGSTPSSALNPAWWTSPDIIVRHNPDGIHIHQNPIAGQTNYIYLNLRNSGLTEAHNVRATLYWANAALGLFWPTSWTEIGAINATIPASGDIWNLPLEWVPTVSGHVCLLLRLEHPEDPITAEGDIPADNNIAQRNVHVLDYPRSLFNPIASGVIEAIAVGAPDGGQVDIRVQITGGEGQVNASIELPPDLMQRWQEAGGTVEGGTVEGDRIIVSDLGETVIRKLPLEPGEEAPIKVHIDGPTQRRYVISVLEEVDGQAVGGNAYVYEGLIPGQPVDLPDNYLMLMLGCGGCWLAVLLALIVMSIMRLRRKPRMVPVQARR